MKKTYKQSQLEYFNLKYKNIDNCSINKYYSHPKLYIKINKHKYFKKYFEFLISRIKINKNINIFLSKQYDNGKSNDKLLNATGIYHLHFNDKVGKNNLIERSDWLLFCKIHDGVIYFIDILPHSNSLWHQPIDLMNKLLDFKNEKLMGIQPKSLVLATADDSDDKRGPNKKLWDAIQNGVNYIFKLKDGKKYTTKITTSGSAIDVVNEFDLYNYP